MANPFSDLGVFDADFEAEMNGDEVFEGKVKLAKKAVRYAKRISPVDTGEFRDHWKVEIDGRNVAVVNDDKKANLLEYGTGGDSPTPEFAVGAQTEAKFKLDDGD